MRRVNPELWAGAAMLAVMLVAAGPVLLGGVPTTIPYALWLGLFIVMVVALLGALWFGEDPRGRRWRAQAVLGAAVLISWVLVIGSGRYGPGLVAILLVLTASLSPYLVPTWAGWTIIALNMVVLLVVFARSSREPGWFAEAAIVSGFYLLIQVASMFSSVALLREQRARRELAEAHLELQAATALLAESTRANERLRISRDLHDLIGHQLTVLTLELEAAKHRAGSGAADGAAPLGAGAAVAHIERADVVARELLASVRATVGELRSGGADLRETLRRVVGDLTEPRIVLEVDDAIELDEERTVLLVRAVQEIVTNTIRHARARELWIELRDTPAGVLLRSSDDGWGAREVVLGNGLRGLRERFEEFGGGAVFDGTGKTASGAGGFPGAGGFSVTARLPAGAAR